MMAWEIQLVETTGWVEPVGLLIATIVILVWVLGDRKPKP